MSDHRAVLPGVRVDCTLVGSSDFRAQVGGAVSLALVAWTRRWVPASAEDRRQPPIRRPPGDEATTELILTGLVLPFVRPCMLGGWVLDIAGIPFHVNEDGTAPEKMGPPAPSTWVRLQASVHVADGYEVDDVEQALGHPFERPWLVHRIVRLFPSRHGGRSSRAEPTRSISFTADFSSYLVDLVSPADR